uniref:Uncharacterized protein n=1 Tax=Callorhinchus milii TaxID=7868 RepID=A0A4W3ICN4_CALMI
SRCLPNCLTLHSQSLYFYLADVVKKKLFNNVVSVQQATGLNEEKRRNNMWQLSVCVCIYNLQFPRCDFCLCNLLQSLFHTGKYPWLSKSACPDWVKSFRAVPVLMLALLQGVCLPVCLVLLYFNCFAKWELPQPVPGVK